MNQTTSSKPVLIIGSSSERSGLIQLLQNNGHDVSCFDSTEDFLVEAPFYRSQIYIVYLRQPGITGFDFIRLLRQADEDAVIIALNDEVSPEKELKAFEYGADYCVYEHAPPELVVVRINNIEAKMKKLELASRGIEFIAEGYTIRRDGKAVKLTPQEYQLVNYLYQNLGKSVSRSDLMAVIGNEQTETRIVDVRIAGIRRKLAPLHLQIVTKRGEGYCLMVDEASELRAS
jgi:DNA-binding response OmpR family regulator